MKVLIFGATGMLGHKLYQEFGRNLDRWGTVRGDAAGLSRFGFYDPERIVGEVRAEDFDSARRAIETVAPDVVINAMGAVKQAAAGADTVQALTTNAIFPHQLAGLTTERGIRLVSISTDCVFSGEKGNYSETDHPDATDLYGLSKRLGEPTGPNVVTIRTSMIGRELQTEHGLVEWFLANRGKAVDGYVDAVFSGLTTRALASVLKDLITDHPDLQGLDHLSAEAINKYELLIALNEAFATGADIRSSHAVTIDRSLDSSLFRTATGWQPPSWAEMVNDMAADTTPYDLWHSGIGA